MPCGSGAHSQVSDFHATYCFEAAQVHFSGRFFGGMVEIMVNTCYLDNSGRTNHFSREFFRRVPSATSSCHVIDFEPVLGTWVNSKSDTQGILQFTLSQTKQQLILHPTGASDPEDWGEINVTPFINPKGEYAFLAEYQFDTYQVYMVANTNKGLWVLAMYYLYKQNPVDVNQTSSHPNFLRREFFYCVDAPKSLMP